MSGSDAVREPQVGIGKLSLVPPVKPSDLTDFSLSRETGSTECISLG